MAKKTDTGPQRYKVSPNLTGLDYPSTKDGKLYHAVPGDVIDDVPGLETNNAYLIESGGLVATKDELTAPMLQEEFYKDGGVTKSLDTHRPAPIVREED